MKSRQQAGSVILLVTQSFDPHADELLVLLRYMGEEPLRLNTEALPADSLLSYRFAAGSEAAVFWAPNQADPAVIGRCSLLLDGRVIDAAQIGSLWWRRPGGYQFGAALSPEEEILAVGETAQALQGFCLALTASGCYWMSEPEALVRASNLPEQLRRAHHFGFALPRSLLSTHPGEVRTFAQATGGRLVYRLLSANAPLPEQRRGIPTLTSAPLLEEHLATIEEFLSVPALFQERLQAQQFYQVVVIGEQVFAAASLGSLESLPHWWSPQVCELPYEPVTLSAELARRCLGFVRSYGLEFGVLTLALGEPERCYFVGLDPLGSFLWLEQQCPQMYMAEALARRLIAGKRSQVCGVL
ncbi:MAG TPA: hypothetical protein VKR06_47060 [Ktedonosporobacter sp.]|nr:hypothetical protein [Ktedonosporobacter sp.]